MLIARQLVVAMLGEVSVVGFLGSALVMASWFTGTARPCAGPGGSSAANPCANLQQKEITIACIKAWKLLY